MNQFKKITLLTFVSLSLSIGTAFSMETPMDNADQSPSAKPKVTLEEDREDSLFTGFASLFIRTASSSNSKETTDQSSPSAKPKVTLEEAPEEKSERVKGGYKEPHPLKKVVKKSGIMNLESGTMNLEREKESRNRPPSIKHRKRLWRFY